MLSWIKKKQLAILGVLVDGEWMDFFERVKIKCLSHFRDRFLAHSNSWSSITQNFLNRLSPGQMENLDSDVMQEEIKKAMLDYGPDKSSVPDGWTFDFIRKFWYLIEANVVVVVMEFLNSYKFPKVCNPSIIALIPKFCDSNCVKDFHPISLLGCRYKIISKFLANHLMLVIEAFE